MFRKLSPIILSLCLQLAASSMLVHYANAQATTTGNLSGTVTDPSGAVIPSATLVITNPATGSRNVQTTNSVGAYTFSALQVGIYQLTTTAPGFATTISKNVVISTGRSSNLNVAMVLGATDQQVSVSSTSQVLETTSNTLAATISPDSVQALPLSGRDTSILTQLAPGSQSAGDQRYATFNSLPAAAINITIDGMNSNFQKFRTNTSGNYSPAPVRLGAIEEVSVSTSDLTADSGAEGAVALRFQIKRGTNKYHGSVFWQHQNSALNANSFANNARGLPKAPFHLNDEGGNIGGPIFKDKLFFFVNYEQEFIPRQTQASAYVLTPDAQAGNITYTDASHVVHSTNVLQVAGSKGFPSTVNPRIASELAQINKYNQTSVMSPLNTLPYQQQANWSYGTQTKNIYPTARIDYQVTPSFDFHVAYDLWWRTLPGAQVYNGDPYTTGAFKSSYQTITAGSDWTITQHLVNQINVGLLNDQERFNPTNSFNPYASVNNIIYSSPGFTNGGALVNPTTATNGLPEPRNNPVRDIFDNITWNKGKHTFTFGGDYRNSTSHDLSISNPPLTSLGLNSNDPIITSGLFTPANFPGLITTGTSTPDLNNLEALYVTLTGRVSGIRGNNNLDTASGNYKVLGDLVEKEAQTVGGIYVQDAWRPTPHLALNYGMRWQFSGTVHNTNNIYTSPTIQDLRGPSTGLFTPGQLGGVQNPQIYLRPSTYSADLMQPAPNVGFAWNPALDDGRLVVRGGAAISHYDEGWEVWENGASNNPGLRQSASITPGPVTNTPSTQFPAGSLTLGDMPALNTAPASFSLPIPQANYTFSNTFSAVDPNIRSPYIENWYFGVQYRIPWNTVLEANYVGNHAIHMWDSYNINEVNIFENNFLQEFQKAQGYLASNPTASFDGPDLPILSQAFGTHGANFKNTTYVNYVKTGQAGALANAIATNNTNFCNLVGNGNGTFSPCTNLGKTTGTAFPINIFLPNPFSAGNAILVSDPGSSSYNGLQAQLKHPVGHGLTLMINYAWSHAFSNRYIGASDTASNNFQTLRNPKLNRAPSPTDLRNSLKAYAVYALPFQGHSFLTKEIVGGWQVSPIFTWQSGRNFKLLGSTQTVNTSDSGVILTGTSVQRLQKAVGYYPGPSGVVPRLLMNPAVFQAPAGGVAPVSSPTTPGVFGQNVYLVGPQFVNTDFAVTKYFTLIEGVKLNIQAEMLNILNHSNWAIQSPGGSNSPAQSASITANPAVPGTVTSQGAGGNRNIQFRVQLAF